MMIKLNSSSLTYIKYKFAKYVWVLEASWFYLIAKNNAFLFGLKSFQFFNQTKFVQQ